VYSFELRFYEVLIKKGSIWCFDEKAATQKVADRPHGVTIAIGALSPIISLIAFVLAFQGYKVAQRSLETTQQSLRLGQRAYLAVTSVSYEPTDTGEFHVHLKNYGNTPAYVRDLSLNLAAIGGKDFRNHFSFGEHFNTDDLKPYSKTLAVISEAVTVGKDEVQLLAGGIDAQLAGMPKDDTIVVALLYYRDIFDEIHELHWGWTLRYKRVKSPISSMVTYSVLLSQGLIPKIGRTETVNRLDYNTPLPQRPAQHQPRN
jgi:hypothetical protein